MNQYRIIKSDYTLFVLIPYHFSRLLIEKKSPQAFSIFSCANIGVFNIPTILVDFNL